MVRSLGLGVTVGTPAKARRSRARGKAAAGKASVTRWASFGVGLMLMLSAALNGFANAQHAPVA